jgi:hypothetical protein
VIILSKKSTHNLTFFPKTKGRAGWDKFLYPIIESDGEITCDCTEKGTLVITVAIIIEGVFEKVYQFQKIDEAIT